MVVTRNEDEQSSGFVDTQALASPEASRSLNLLLWGISIAIAVVLLLTERRHSYVLPLILLLPAPLLETVSVSEMPYNSSRCFSVYGRRSGLIRVLDKFDQALGPFTVSQMARFIGIR